MKRYAPLLTLLAVAVLGAVLFVVNSANNDRAAQVAAPAAPTAAVPTTTTAPAITAAPTAAPPAVAEKAYTGRSAGNEVTVAIAVKAGRAVGYVCDGRRIEAWLEGTVTGEDVTLRSADGTTTVTGTVDETASLGTVAVGERSWPYSAVAVVAPAGLYEGRANIDGVANRIGWIVENDGRVTGALRVDGELRPAPALDPADLDGVVIDGVAVPVEAVDGGDPVIRP